MLKRRRVITAIAVTASLTVLCGVGSAKAAGAPHAAPPTAGAQSTPAGSPAASAAAQTAAWRDGALQVNTQELVSRSDLVLQSPPSRQEQSMPLGNGRLGAAVWDADGLTVYSGNQGANLQAMELSIAPRLSRKNCSCWAMTSRRFR